MAKRPYHDPVLTKSLPSTTVPLLVILGLLACIWLTHKYFFGPPQQLLGGPPPKNEYSQYLAMPAKPLPDPVPAPHPAQPLPTTPSDVQPVHTQASPPHSTPTAPHAGHASTATTPTARTNTAPPSAINLR